MSEKRSALIEVAMSDRRFAPEAYEFLCHALNHTQKQRERAATPDVGVIHHVSGQELLEGIRQFALEQFGQMAYVVFRQWGILKTGDFGAMVFRLIDAKLWYRSPTDRIEDFEDVYDFEQVFVRDFHIAREDMI